MAPANATWAGVLQRAQADPATALAQPDVVRAVANVLQTNASACVSLGHSFLPQMLAMLDPMLRLYQLYSEGVCRAIAEGGPHAARSSAVRHLRGVKKAVLRLVEAFVERCEDDQLLATRVVPALLDPVLGDYARSLPDARDAEALSCFTAVVNKLQAGVSPQVPRILEAVFEPTLAMITRNFEDYPEHRLRFFALLAAVTNHCFPSLLAMSAPQLKLLMDSIVWAFRHTERNVAEVGLALLLDLCSSFSESPYATSFFSAYYATLVREVMAVMTDAFHKPGFKLHARILHLLFAVVRVDAPQPTDPHRTAALPPSPSGLQPATGPPLPGGNLVIRAPLWDVASKGAAAYPSNAAYVREFATELLRTSFPNLTPQQVDASVAGMLDLRDFSAFKHHLRDFLVQSRAFASADNAELFAEEVAAQRAEQEARLAAIPGMVPPSAAVGDEMG
jgi:exportin-1